MDTNYTMREAAPPVRANRPPLADTPMYAARRAQLVSKPNTWHVWSENAAHANDLAKIVRGLAGLKTNDKASLKTLRFKGTRRRNADGTFTIFVGYFPNGAVEAGN